jgi:hypothetical protein
MKSKAIRWALPICAILALVTATGARAATPKLPMTFSGEINDYTPQNPVAGPWEVRGHWTLVVGSNGKANFWAELTMERSDLGTGAANLDDPTIRNAHTHHISLIQGTVSLIPGGFQVVGPSKITANGKFPPPFGAAIPTLTVQVTGNNSVVFSNVALTFGSPADMHFGTNPIHGVVITAQ